MPAPQGLAQILDRLAGVADGGGVTVGEMVEAAGRRSFGPLLLVAGLIPASPLSGVPGLPSLAALVVFLVAGQLLLRRDHFWLPGWLLRRRVSARRFRAMLRWLRPPARFIDRWMRPRLTALTGGVATYLIAATCVAIAIAMPPLELVPFANSTSGIALSAFGLALIAHDGLLALLALLFALATVALVLLAS
jgi:hypothetical protein